MNSRNGFSNTPLWEKLVGLLGFGLICYTVVFLVWSAMTNKGEGPEFEFTISEIRAADTRFVLVLNVRNTGDLTASDLHLEAQLTSAADTVERTTARVDYLAANSVRRVGFYFDHDPAAGELVFRALGYQEP